MGDREVNIIITKKNYQYHWRKMKERTASTFLGRHFGHYKAAASGTLRVCMYLSEVHARTLSVITKTGAAPSRWSKGLPVMLEKIASVALVTKLRTILLMKADFNCHKRLIFGDPMIMLARENRLMPGKIYSEKGMTSEDSFLHQMLFFDIAR